MGGDLPQPDEREQAELSVAGNWPAGGDPPDIPPTSRLMRVLLHQMVCASTHRRASESGLWARFLTRETFNLWQGGKNCRRRWGMRGTTHCGLRRGSIASHWILTSNSVLFLSPNARPCRPVVFRQAARSRWVEDFVGGDAKSAEGLGVQ